MFLGALQIQFEATYSALLGPVAVLSLCALINTADAQPAASVASDAESPPLRAVHLVAATKKESSKARTETKNRPKESGKKPRCIDVGGYEAYMRRTGKTCMIGAEGYTEPGYRLGR